MAHSSRIGDGSYIASGNPVLKGGPFCGMIDDVMIFNRALTADEVEQLYLGRAVVNVTGLWNLYYGPGGITIRPSFFAIFEHFCGNNFSCYFFFFGKKSGNRYAANKLT